jgi:hypothetical protein
MNTLGEQVPYNCPGCGGVLWKIDGRGEKRYRCHTGHSYSGLSLLASQSEKIETRRPARTWEDAEALVVAQRVDCHATSGRDLSNPISVNDVL